MHVILLAANNLLDNLTDVFTESVERVKGEYDMAIRYRYYLPHSAYLLSMDFFSTGGFTVAADIPIARFFPAFDAAVADAGVAIVAGTVGAGAWPPAWTNA